MVEVFTTDMTSKVRSRKVLGWLKDNYPGLKIDLDLEDFNEPYPCGHSILRVEGEFIDTNSILRLLKTKGIECGILEDKICS